MAEKNRPNQPVATLFAIVPCPARGRDSRPDRWVRVGSLWQARETSNLVGELDAIPFSWLSGSNDARISVVFSGEPR